MGNLLLIKLKDDKYYLRKNAWKYINVDLFIIVDNDNQVVGYTFFDILHDNDIEFISKDTSNEKLRNIIGESRLNKMKHDDYYFKFNIYNYYKLATPLKIYKKVNGLRYATPTEETLIKTSIIKGLIQEHNITFKDKLYNTPKYSRLYNYCMEHELDEGLFNKLYYS